VLEILDEWAAFGKDLEITEFDLGCADDQVHADYVRDFMTAMFALFLVLWIVNQSTDIRSAVAGYFQDPLGRADDGHGPLRPLRPRKTRSSIRAWRPASSAA
jgi:flagellar motor protein MotB